MPTITKQQLEDYERLCRDRNNGRLLTPDGLRFICEANKYDAETIGEYFLKLFPKNAHDAAPPTAERTIAKEAIAAVKRTSDAQFIFRISEYLSAKGFRNESTIGDAIIARKNGRQFTFPEHIKGLIYSLLTNQTPWKRIVPHLHEVDNIFFNYDIEAIKAKPGSYFEGELRKIKCGNRKTKAQMIALHHNIRVFEQISEAYGSMDAFVTSAPALEIVTALSSNNSDYKLKQVGEALAWEYIRNVGIDGAKPDLHLRRFFGCNRMGLSKRETASVPEVLDAVDALSEKTGLTKAAIDNLIWSYCADGFGEVCTSSPRCHECVIRQYCHYYAQKDSKGVVADVL